jgi:hypothetical protein
MLTMSDGATPRGHDADLGRFEHPMNHATDEEMDRAVDAVWEGFWWPLMCPDGVLNAERVKAELYDYHVLMDNASKVYDHVTGGRISKTSTTAEAVIAEADARIMEDIERAIDDDRESRPEADDPPAAVGFNSEDLPDLLDPVMDGLVASAVLIAGTIVVIMLAFWTRS